MVVYHSFIQWEYCMCKISLYTEDQWIVYIQQNYSLCLHSVLSTGQPGYSLMWVLSRSPRLARLSPGSVLGAPVSRTHAHLGSLGMRIEENDVGQKRSPPAGIEKTPWHPNPRPGDTAGFLCAPEPAAVRLSPLRVAGGKHLLLHVALIPRLFCL